MSRLRFRLLPGGFDGRRAVTPVIATVIVLAVGITIAVAVAFWMTGIASQYTKVEKVEIQLGVCTWNSTGGYWKIEIKLKNTGTKTATLIQAFVNDAEVQNYDNNSAVIGETSTNMTSPISIDSGVTLVINLYISQGYESLSMGTMVNISLRSSGGMDYPLLVELA
jgi:hypothetical protein